jgi:hypothetical protein
MIRKAHGSRSTDSQEHAVITPWYRAVSYAAIVTLASWALGEVTYVLWALPADVDVGTWARAAFPFPDELVFPVSAIVVLTGVRMLLPALSRSRTVAVDASLYALVMLVTSTVQAAVYGDEAPVDTGVVTLFFGLYSLQIPAALALSAWAYGRLVPVVRGVSC